MRECDTVNITGVKLAKIWRFDDYSGPNTIVYSYVQLPNYFISDTSTRVTLTI